MSNTIRWPNALAQLLKEGRSAVLVSIIETRGSSPREQGAKMVVAKQQIFDTIGGGELEFRASNIAYDMLSSAESAVQFVDFPLGPELNQCCGGNVKLMFECFPSSNFHIQLYGAGHVARAMVNLFGELDCTVRWIDERTDEFPQEVPDNITSVITDAFAVEVEAAPSSSWHLILTHSHSLDLEICDAVLSRADFSYCGLIGSKSKGTRFRKRLTERGFSKTELSRLNSPIGLPGMDGKRPMEIAISVVADLIQRHQQQQSITTHHIKLVEQ
jgi:xanthine dehydrogenase accessory factor